MIGSESRVLIVDGQPRIRRLLDTMLHVSGVRTIHAASDANLAKEILQSRPVDFVLYDWGTPVMNGVDFLRAVRALSVTKFLPSS
jgi:DNA-binding response OmpR family regulator